jgi:hypothetical protein
MESPERQSAVAIRGLPCRTFAGADAQKGKGKRGQIYL